MTVLETTDATFENDVLRSPEPVFLDLYADWCQPCKQMAPIIEALATEFAGQIRFVKANVEHNPMIAQSFRAQSIPMLLVFSQGQVVQHHTGALDREGILKLLESVRPRSQSELNAAELAQLIAQGRAVPVDIRDAASFARYRIPRAVHIAASELNDRVADLNPSDGRVRVLYGRTDDEAKKACEHLNERGVQIGYLAGGFLHWEADGLDVERG